MTTTRLAKNYAALSPAERLPLIVAASVRGDDVEYQQLVDSAPREQYRVPHTFGLSVAFREVAEQHHMELLTVAGHYLHALAVADSTPGVTGQRVYRAGLLFGYLYRTYRAGWRAFCDGLHMDADAIPSVLPGDTLIDMADSHAEHTAFSHEAAVQYAKRKYGEAAVVLAAEDVAAALRDTYEVRAKLWD